MTTGYTEIYKNLKVGNKNIKANWEGLSNEEIKLIRKRYKFIDIREGIPFIPVFLISFLIFVFLWYSPWKPYFFFF